MTAPTSQSREERSRMEFHDVILKLLPKAHGHILDRYPSNYPTKELADTYDMPGVQLAWLAWSAREERIAELEATVECRTPQDQYLHPMEDPLMLRNMQLSKRLEKNNKDYEDLAIMYRQLQIKNADLERRLGEAEKDAVKLKVAVKTLEEIVDGAVHPDKAVRRVMVDLAPIRATIAYCTLP